MSASEVTSASFFPFASIIGPADSEAMIIPIACANAIFPFCSGVRLNDANKTPNIAAMTP